MELVVKAIELNRCQLAESKIVIASPQAVDECVNNLIVAYRHATGGAELAVASVAEPFFIGLMAGC